MSRNLMTQLKQLKNNPELGSVRASVKARSRDTLMQAIGHTDSRPEHMTLGDIFIFYRWNVSQFVSMPATLTASLFVLVLGGWMTTVSAASSLPGDTLYGLKLVTERAQLSIASLEHKAVLHTEFAENRLEEAVALESSTDPDSLLYLNEALVAFASELSLAEVNLRQLKDEGNLETIVIASAVDQKIIALNAVIDNRLEDNGDLPNSAADEIRDITREASNGVVDVIVETHEASLDAFSTAQDLRALFKVKLQDLNSREALDLGRIVVIERAAELNDLDILMLNATNEIVSAMATVPESESLSAAGGYGAAFDILRDAENGLMAAEAMIVEAELSIIQMMIAPEETLFIEETAAEGNELIESIDSTLSETDS